MNVGRGDMHDDVDPREIAGLSHDLEMFGLEFEREAMTTRQDLWDGTGDEDPEVRDLLAALRPFSYRAELSIERRRTFLRRISAAAAVLLAAFSFYALLNNLPSSDPLPRKSRSDGSLLARAGLEVIVDASDQRPKRLVVGRLGFVDVDPGSKMRVLSAEANLHHLYLAEGSATATIGARARTFQIGTPAGMAVDLGCKYRVDVRKDGATSVVVVSGAISFETAGKKVWMPRGTTTVSIPGRGPGAPVWDGEVGDDYREALDTIEFSRTPSSEALAKVLRESRPKDGITIYHLLASSDETVRTASFERLEALCPPSAEVDLSSARRGDLAALERWRDEMTLRYWY